MATEPLFRLIELFPGPALVIGPSGEIVGVNDRAEQWIGLCRAELIGRPLSQIVAESSERVASFLEDCGRRGRKVVGTLTSSRDGGAGGECRVEGISVPVPSGADESPLVVVHILPGEPGGDPVAADQPSALESLQAELRRRDEFLARLAHDLSSPVAAISGALHLVRKATSREDMAWAEDAMDRQIQHLMRQIDDLKELSRIARGRLELKRRRPAATDSPASRAASDDRTGLAAPAGERILIVDDNVDAARGTARLLQLAGYDIRVAHDGREALEIAHDHQPRFVLLDIGLPVMDGYEVARQLRGDPRHRDATIIAVSGYSQDDYRQPQEAGFDHHLVKPIDYDALRAILSRPAREVG